MVEQSIYLEMLINLALAMAGLAIYSLWAVKDKLKVFSMKIFISENKPFWIWAILLQISMVLLVSLSPDSAAALKTFVGIDFTEAGAFIMSGWLLAIAANQVSDTTMNNRIGVKPK